MNTLNTNRSCYAECNDTQDAPLARWQIGVLNIPIHCARAYVRPRIREITSKAGHLHVRRPWLRADRSRLFVASLLAQARLHRWRLQFRRSRGRKVLQSDKEAQSSELSSSEGSSDEIEQSAIEDRIGHGEVISVTDREILAKRRKIAHRRRKGGVSPSWLKEFPWLRSVRGKNGKAGMRCHLCTKHSIVPRSGSTSWTSYPCFSVRKDKVVKHAKSQMHKQAEVMELQAGGIPRAFDEAYALEMKAAIGCCKCIYWLCKQEVSHITTYPHLLSLAENLGCDYFKALNLGQNAKYTSPQIVTEFLDVINGVVEEEVLSDMKGSSSYSVMADESTDVSVLKQLVLYGRAVVGGTENKVS